MLSTSFQSTTAGGSSSSSLTEFDPKSLPDQKSKVFLTKMWNPVLFAIYNNQIDVAQFLLTMDTPYKLNKRLSLYQTPFTQEDS